jgi:transglutaminase-like putative cysteine protease
MMAASLATTLPLALSSPESVSADTVSTDTPSSDSRVTYDLPKSQTWKMGLILKSPVTCANVFATFPVPMDWPEQKVTLEEKNIDPRVTGWEVVDVAPGAKHLVLKAPKIAANTTMEVTLTMTVERSRILAPTQTDDLVAPKRIGRDLKIYTGTSPYIDATNARIKAASKELAANAAENAWDYVEQIYDFVRDKVKYVEGDLKNASVALRDGKGDCEEMTSLFIALCRNARIPARMVWIPDHCYPEFYLEDGDGNGHWFPCQAAGTRSFGRMAEYRPVWQKGDRFKVPQRRGVVRYVTEFFKCDPKGKGTPRPSFIREVVEV